MIEVEYLAMVFLVVYVGAIAVLFLFVVMMLAPKLETTSHSDNFGLFPFVPLVFILFGELSLVGDQKGPLFRNEATSWIQQLDGYAHIESIGQVLYTYYFYYLIVAGLVLLMALVGAIVLTLPNPQKGLDSFNSITPPSLANFSTQPVMEQISRDPRSAVFLV
jgi:NADH-quinone oxidoreductase subunit J